MVLVDAVLHKQLPVGPYVVLVDAGHHTEPAFGLVHDHVDVLSCPCQVVDQRLNIGVIADEYQPAVVLHPRRR